MATNPKQAKRARRHRRSRAKIFGTSERPRLCVFKSNTRLVAEVIDDALGVTLAAASGKDAESVGREVAKKALAKSVEKVSFDRGGYVYTGKVKTLAEGARAGGLKF